MRRLKCIVDFDGVIVDILPQWCEKLRKEGYKDCYPDNITAYTMETNSCLSGISRDLLMETLKNVNYLTPKKTPWLPGVQSNLPNLIGLHDFTFVSCQPVNVECQMAAKNSRLQQLVPRTKVNHHDDSKTRISLVGDVLIDDRLDVIMEWCICFPDRLGILMDAPYNQEVELRPNMARAKNWSEVAFELNAFARPLPAPPEPPPMPKKEIFPIEAKARKTLPLYSGFIAYFPDALLFVGEQPASYLSWTFGEMLAKYSKTKNPIHLFQAWQYLTQIHPEGEDGLKRDVAKVSWLGNEQHNPGQPLHWDRKKSMDQLDAAARHEVEYCHGKVVDEKGFPIIGQIGWRVMAELQVNREAKMDISESESKKAGIDP